MHNAEAVLIKDNVWKLHNKMLCNTFNADNVEHGGKRGMGTGGKEVYK